jgi:hypothetical protein
MQLVINILLVLLLSFNSQLLCEKIRQKETLDQTRSKTGKIKPNHKLKKAIQFQKIADIPVPSGYERVKTDGASFGNYLRNLSLNTNDNKVYSFDGSVIMDETYGYQFAVVDMDIGKRDLQQCADAVMRLRAEYLYQEKKYGDIHFNFLSDSKARYYIDYAKTDRSYTKFRKYMDYIFAYANTASLKKELTKVDKPENMQIGDVFIQSGRPFGHAVIVVDVAINKQTGDKIFIVAQSFMPAQSIHILKNKNKDLNPWYSINFNEQIVFPSWTFYPNDLRRF